MPELNNKKNKQSNNLINSALKMILNVFDSAKWLKFVQTLSTKNNILRTEANKSPK